jgi:hypothetical protein
VSAAAGAAAYMHSGWPPRCAWTMALAASCREEHAGTGGKDTQEGGHSPSCHVLNPSDPTPHSIGADTCRGGQHSLPSGQAAAGTARCEAAGAGEAAAAPVDRCLPRRARAAPAPRRSPL